MKYRTLGALAISFALFAAVFVPSAHADAWDKKTIVTFPEPVQVPGTVLQPGTYVFELLNDQADRNIVVVWNADKSKVITTFIGVPDYQMDFPGKTIFKFDERPRGEPEALKAWFYPGDNYGLEFVYPKNKETSEVTQNDNPSVIPASYKSADVPATTAPMVNVSANGEIAYLANSLQKTASAEVPQEAATN
jgi:hypothetical protein